VNVVADGRCFFRCVASSGVRCLQQGARSRSGRLTESHLADTEVRFADQIRKSTVTFLRQRSNELNGLVDSVPFLLDRSINEGPYSSLEARLQMMFQNDEYAGYLEVTAVAYIVQRPIFVYMLQPQTDDNKLKLIAKLPPAIADNTRTVAWENRQAILLIHTFDTDQRPGHFDLLVDKNVTLTEDPLSLTAFMSALAAIDKREVSFTYVLRVGAVDRGAEKEAAPLLDNLPAQEDTTCTNESATSCSGSGTPSW